jgi:hypothetical protein
VINPPAEPESLSRLIYADDSGDPRFGWAIYGWVECSPAHWRLVLREWLELRKRLWVEYKVPPSQELHATDYVNGRGRISTDPTVTLWKDLGREVARDCLQLLRDCEHLRVGAVFRKTSKTGSEYHLERADLYLKLVEQWDAEQAARNSFAMISMDGDGSDRSYFEAHRALKLDARHIIEDPIFHDSKRSQWTQMADLVAFVANAHLDRHDKNEFAWTWYEEFLTGSDPSRSPKPL